MKPEVADSVGPPVVSLQQQQVSPPSNVDKIPEPLWAPLKPLPLNEQRVNEETTEFSNVLFAEKDENIKPVDRSKEAEFTVALWVFYI